MNTLDLMLHAETMDTELNATLFTNMKGEPCSVVECVTADIEITLEHNLEVDSPAYDLHNINGHYFDQLEEKLRSEVQDDMDLFMSGIQ